MPEPVLLPQRLAGGLIESDELAIHPAGEQQPAICCEHACGNYGFRHGHFPFRLAGQWIERHVLRSSRSRQRAVSAARRFLKATVFLTMARPVGVRAVAQVTMYPFLSRATRICSQAAVIADIGGCLKSACWRTAAPAVRGMVMECRGFIPP